MPYKFNVRSEVSVGKADEFEKIVIHTLSGMIKRRKTRNNKIKLSMHVSTISRWKKKCLKFQSGGAKYLHIINYMDEFGPPKILLSLILMQFGLKTRTNLQKLSYSGHIGVIFKLDI